MIETITPAVCGGRNRHRVAVAAFTVGAITAAALLGGVLGLLGAAVGAREAVLAAAALAAVAAARDAGLGVVFITHNPHHAYLVGDHFVILKLGQAVLDRSRNDVTLDELTRQMAGGDELAELSHELQR